MYFYLFFSYLVQVAAPYHVTLVRSFTKYIFFRPVTRILCRGANEAKVDQTTETYFLFSDPFIQESSNT